MKAKELAKMLLEYPEAECEIITSHSPFETHPVVGISVSYNEDVVTINK